MPRATAGHRVLLAALLSALSFRSQPAHATPGHFELLWSAPTTCPSVDDVERRVERILNRPLMLADDEVLIVKAQVEPPGENRAWRVEVETDNGRRSATRTLAAASCDELANATAILVAILLEPAAPHTTPAPVGVSAKRPAPASSHSEVSVEPRTPPRWLLGAMGGVIAGALPGWSPGLGAQGAVAWKAFRAGLGAMFWLPAEKSLADAGNQGANFALVSAQSRLCAQWPGRKLQPAFCAGAQLSLLRARGFGPGITPELQHAKFASISAGPALVWRQSERLSFVLDVAGLLPLGSRRFVFSGTDPAVVYTPALGVQLECGAEFNL